MVFGWLIRLLVLMVVVRLVWKLLTGFAQGATTRAPVSPSTGVKLVRDPVCGTYVDQTRALTARRRGAEHYFCSADCRAAFLEGRGTPAA